MIPLPIDAHLGDILAAAKEHRRVVIVAPPGSGKTTRVAPAMARSGLLWPLHPALVMLQPRRIAARASAKRIADENNWTLGREVGYQIRGEKRVTPDSLIRVETEGILTRQLLSDPYLDGIGAVILDEFHERNIHTDLALALLREVAETVRDDLILVVMSATLDAEPVSHFLGGCPIIRAEGRTFPVAIEYTGAPDARQLPERVAAAVNGALAAGDRGDILVFLPGVEEIRRSARAISAQVGDVDALILPLHGGLSAAEQDRALQSSPIRKIVLATNVAETSLTIDGITAVIDSGLARIARHDPTRGLDRLELSKISRASADQRAGRAGRTAPGRCIRLWMEREDRGRPAFDEPEIQRIDLASTILTLKAWGQRRPAEFGWFEPPAPESLAAAEALLHSLGAVDASGAITSPGRQMLDIPAHPRLARLMIAATSRGLTEVGAGLAALMSEKDIVPLRERDGRAPARGEFRRGRSDLLERLDLLEDAAQRKFPPGLRDRGIDPSAARRAWEIRSDLLRMNRSLKAEAPPAEGEREDVLLALALLAYPDRVCRRRGTGLETARMVGGRGIRLDPDSIVKDDDFFLAIDPREAKGGTGREARVRIASAIDATWLADLFPEAIRRERIVTFDESRGRAYAVDAVFYNDLPIREASPVPANPNESSAALATWLTPRAATILQEDEAAAAWLTRLQFLRRAIPEAELPEFDHERLAELVAEACAGKTTLEAVRRASWVPLLRGTLSFAQSRLLDEEAPETMLVPTGNRLRLKYDDPARPPVLAVRLQELFGLAETPRVAKGRVPVLLHLLGPNYRPVQVTDDLRSFWNTTYFQVRKDLRNRYPKHSWPEDPWNAPPVAKGRSEKR